MTHRGQPWEEPAHGAAAIHVAGGDADLARAAAGAPGAVLRFTPAPSSDLARALGVRPGAGAADATSPAAEVAVDVLHIQCSTGGAATSGALGMLAVDMLAVNMVVCGVAPDRMRVWSRRRRCQVELDGEPWWDGPATTVVVANGEFLRGADVVPRGHPGDGRLEVQVYALAPSARRAMRRRLATGTHLPHPSIRTGQGQRVKVRWEGAPALEIDGIALAGQPTIGVDLVPARLRLVL